MAQPDIFESLVPVLYEDSDLIAVCKPAGLDVGVLATAPGRGVTELLRDVRHLGDDLEPVNRLSRFESGVLLLARTPDASRRLRAGLRGGAIVHDYLAITRGRTVGRRFQLGNAVKPTQPVPRNGDGGRRGGRRGSSAIRNRTSHQKRGGLDDASAVTTVSGEVLQRGREHIIVRCRTRLRSAHALKAMLRAAGLRVLGDTRGGPGGGTEGPRDQGTKGGRALSTQHSALSTQRSCLHLAAMAFTHPRLGRKVSVHAPLPPGFDELADGTENIERTLLAALASRLEILMDDSTDAYRLIHGDTEGLPGLTAERFGEVIILQEMPDRCRLNRAARRRVGRFFLDRFGAAAVYRKVYVKERAGPDPILEAEHRAAEPMLGRPVEAVINAHERGMVFRVRPYDGFSVGLFLDHRDNRDRVRRLAGGKRVLNLFAYTCGFSVAAALGGAESTTSVDLSKTHLEWGKENFAANGLSLEGHVFVASDAMEYFDRARRQQRRFDFIIMDPPTFARGKKPRRTFSITEDLPDLVRESLTVLDPGGLLMISTNCRTLSASKLNDLAQRGAPGRRLRVLETPPLPVDFASDPHFAKTVFLSVT